MHLQNPNRGEGGKIVQLKPFPGGNLPMCGGGGSGNMWGRYDEWTRVKGLRYAAGKIVTGLDADEVRTRSTMQGIRTLRQQRRWLYREGGEADASAADAASLGWAALLLERAGAEDPMNPVVGVGRSAYGEAADEMIRWLFEENPWFWLDDDRNLAQEKSGEASKLQSVREIGKSQGRKWALSHRVDSPQLWADSVFMVPPFLAAYAVARQDDRWLWEAVEQIKAYNQVLSVRTSNPTGNEQSHTGKNNSVRSTSGLWKHIVSTPRELGEGVCCHDEGLWLTGNAWVLAGVVRVLSVIERWVQVSATGTKAAGAQMRSDQRRQEAGKVLKDIANSMLWSLRPTKPCEGRLLTNYLDLSRSENNASLFREAAGSALIVSSIYRLAQIEGLADSGMLTWADELYNAVAAHIDRQGILNPVTTVNEIPAHNAVAGTSEGQSFVIMMYAARRDCAKMGLCRTSDRGSWWARLL